MMAEIADLLVAGDVALTRGLRATADGSLSVNDYNKKTIGEK